MSRFQLLYILFLMCQFWMMYQPSKCSGDMVFSPKNYIFDFYFNSSRLHRLFDCMSNHHYECIANFNSTSRENIYYYYNVTDVIPSEGNGTETKIFECNLGKKRNSSFECYPTQSLICSDLSTYYSSSYNVVVLQTNNMTMYGDEVGNFSAICSGQLQKFYYIEEIASTSTTAATTFLTSTTHTTTTSDFTYTLITDESNIPSYAMYLSAPTDSSTEAQTTDTSTSTTTSSAEYTNTISDIRPTTLTSINNTTSFSDSTFANLSSTFSDLMSASTASTMSDTSTVFDNVSTTSTNITTLASSTSFITTTPTDLTTIYPTTTTSATTTSALSTTSSTFTITPTHTTSFSMYLTTTPTSPTTLSTPTATTTPNTPVKQITISSSYTTSSPMLTTTLRTTITYQTSPLSTSTTTATTTTITNTDLKPTESNKTTTIIITVCVVGAVVIVVCIIVVILVLRCHKKRRDKSHIRSVVVTSTDLTENNDIQNVSYYIRPSQASNVSRGGTKTPAILVTNGTGIVSQPESQTGYREDGYKILKDGVDKTSSATVLISDHNESGNYVNIISRPLGYKEQCTSDINNIYTNQNTSVDKESITLETLTDNKQHSQSEYHRLGQERRDLQNPYQQLLQVEQEQQLVMSDQELPPYTLVQTVLGETTLHTDDVRLMSDNSFDENMSEADGTSKPPQVAETTSDIQRDSLGYTLLMTTEKNN